jgi:hypothetical protein
VVLHRAAEVRLRLGGRLPSGAAVVLRGSGAAGGCWASRRAQTAQIWALRAASGSGQAGALGGRRVLRMKARWQGGAAAVAGLLQRGGRLYGPRTGPAGPRRDWFAPRGGFTGMLSLAGPNGDWCALLPRPVDYRHRRWRQFPPAGRGSVAPLLATSFLRLAGPRVDCLGETMMAASWS